MMRIKNSIFLVICLIIFLISPLKTAYHNHKILLPLENNVYDIVCEVEFNDSILIKYLEFFEVYYIDIAIAKSILETRIYSSESFTRGNNLFGMKNPRIRKTTSIGTFLGHALYHSWMESILDYKLWQEYYNVHLMGYDEYIKLLDRIYAEDPYYINKLKQIKSYVP